MKPFNSLISYFSGVSAEMRKVVWPTFPMLVRYFLSVVVGIALATLFIGTVDFILIKGLAVLIGSIK